MDRSAKLLGHLERNRELLRIFREKRIDLEKARSIDIRFWSSDQSSAVRLASELYKRGYTLLLLGPARVRDKSDLWNIEASTLVSISRAASEDFASMLTDLAAEFGAEFDGWGTSV